MRQLAAILAFSLLYALGVSHWAAHERFVSVPTFTASKAFRTISMSPDRSHLLSNVAALREVTVTVAGTVTMKWRYFFFEKPTLSLLAAPFASSAHFICLIGGFILSIISQIGLFVLFRALLF